MLDFFFANIFRRNSIQRHVRLAFCAFFIYLYLFFFFNSHVRLRASNFYCCIVLTFLFFFLFFYFYYCNNVFCVTTSHRYLHWATHMKGSVNSDNEKSRFISGGICRQHCLSHVSFMAAFAYIKCRICMCVCMCVRMFLYIWNLLNCLPHCRNENWTWTEMEIVIKFETKTKSRFAEY